ncbi:Rtc4 protein [Martiniozyma asiatica (nom. inval.)]|nr:Rtc4 protein [Martiniozyma asiatica]
MALKKKDFTSLNQRHLVNSSIILSDEDPNTSSVSVISQPTNDLIPTNQRKRALPQNSLYGSTKDKNISPKRKKSDAVIYLTNGNTYRSALSDDNLIKKTELDEVDNFLKNFESESNKDSKDDFYFEKYLRPINNSTTTTNNNNNNTNFINKHKNNYKDSKLTQNLIVKKILNEEIDLDALKKEQFKKMKAANESIDVKTQLSDEYKIEKVKEKYKKMRPNFKPFVFKNILEIDKVVKELQNYIIDILKGKVGSFFYTQAKNIQRKSKRNMITDDELISLPKNIYYGYIGSKRGFLIAISILDNLEIKNIVDNVSLTNNVMQFWGIDAFAQYVLAPEVIAKIIMKEKNLKDLELAYDEMEYSNDYGFYIMNNIKVLDRFDLQHAQESEKAKQPEFKSKSKSNSAPIENPIDDKDDNFKFNDNENNIEIASDASSDVFD